MIVGASSYTGPHPVSKLQPYWRPDYVLISMPAALQELAALASDEPV
jgi:hypothetical protein